MTLYFENEQTYTTAINSNQLSNDINTVLKEKIQSEIEGKCVNNGYIKRDSVRLLKRSMGKLMMSQFNGNIIYNITYSAQVCNPQEGDIIKCKVKSINKMGIMAYIDDEDSPMSLLLAKQHHQENENFTKLQEEEEISVKIIAKRFEFGDNKISVIGALEDDTKEPIQLEADLIGEQTDVAENLGVDNLVYTTKTKTYKWLSNYNITEPFSYNGRKFVSLEHALNSTKNKDDDFKDLFTHDSETYVGDLPNLAKKTGNKTNMKKMKKTIDADWEDNKLEILEEIMRDYFTQNTELKEKLLKTGNNNLIFRDTDKYWGMDKDDNGENNHGKLLMKLRSEFKA